MTRQHRNQIAYPALWRAIDGAVRDAAFAHDDIQIPQRRIASIVKRCVGQVLALKEAGAVDAAETALGAPISPDASDVHCGSVTGLVNLPGQPQ